MELNNESIKEIILNLLYSYTNKDSDKPTSFEVMSVEMALPYIKEGSDEHGMYQSYVEWIERHKVDTVSY